MALLRRWSVFFSLSLVFLLVAPNPEPAAAAEAVENKRDAETGEKQLPVAVKEEKEGKKEAVTKDSATEKKEKDAIQEEKVVDEKMERQTKVNDQEEKKADAKEEKKSTEGSEEKEAAKKEEPEKSGNNTTATEEATTLAESEKLGEDSVPAVEESHGKMHFFFFVVVLVMGGLLGWRLYGEHRKIVDGMGSQSQGYSFADPEAGEDSFRNYYRQLLH